MLISIPWWLALIAILMIAVLASAVAFYIECDQRGVRPRTRVRQEARRCLERIGDLCYDISDRV